MSKSDAGIVANESYLFQALESSLKSAFVEAIETLDLINNGDKITADELQSVADALRNILESVVSGGLARSHPLIAEATKANKSFRDMVTKTMVSAVDVASTLEFMR